MSAIPIAEKLLNDKFKASLKASRRDQVLSFHEFYKQPIAANADLDSMSNERAALRLGLILEEVKEMLLDGFGVVTEITFNPGPFGSENDLVKALEKSNKRDIVGLADALGDISYVVDGFAIELGVNLDEVLNEIHASNMTKPDEHGNPIYRADGKVLKGPFYTKPDIYNVLMKDTKCL